MGSALCMIDKAFMTCEFAMTVADDYDGAGLGCILLSNIIEAAKQRGLEEMTGLVLAANEPMPRLAKRTGFSMVRDPDDASARICRVSLRD